MAPAFRTSAVGGSSTGTTDRTVAITGALDDLLVVCGVFATNTNTAPTCSDSHGGQYVLVHAGLHNSGADMHCMFVRSGPVGYASAHTITVATGSNTAGEVVAVAYSGMQRWGTDAIKQVAFQDAQVAGTPAPAFASAVQTGNPTVGMVAKATNPATMTAPTNWTERQDVGQTLNNAGVEVVTRDSGFTGTTLTWGSASATDYGAIVVELDSSAAVTFPGVATAVQRIFNTAPTTGTQSTPSITTQASGSTVLLGAARGSWANDGSPPFDNKGNTFTALASAPHSYNGFITSDAGVWGCAGALGGAGHVGELVWGASTASNGDEVTVSLVEIDSLNTIQASAFQDDTSTADTMSTASVTTTGPAILIAYFWGYGNTGQLHNFRPQVNGWRRLTAASTDGDPDPAGYVQCTVLWAQVAGAGTYSCIASGVAQEAAMTWIVAVQAGPIIVHGAGSNTIAAVTDSAAGTVVVKGAANDNIAAVTSSAAGNLPVQGSANDTIVAVTSTAAGSVPAQGSANDTIQNVTVNAAGNVPAQGAANDTIAPVTSAAVGKVVVSGAAADTVSPLTSSAAGAVVVQGAAADTVAPVTSSAAGKVVVTGAAADTIAAIAATGFGQVPVQGSAIDTIAAVASTAAGAVVVTGAATDTIGSVGISATAGGAGAIGTSNVTVAPVSAAAAGAVVVTGAATGNISPVTSSASGSVPAQGTANDSIGTTSANAAGAVPVQGAASDAITNVTPTAVGVVPVQGTAGDVIANVVVAGHAGSSTSTSTGDLAATIADPTATAAGSVVVSGTLSETVGAIGVTSAFVPVIYDSIVGTGRNEVQTQQRTSGVTVGDTRTSVSQG